MRPAHRIRFDVASDLSVGKRDYQEDALAIDFPEDGGFGIAVLADGMGGHAAGDVASRIVIETVTAELAGNTDRLANGAAGVRAALNDATSAANDGVRDHTANNPEARGMGTTLVATVFRGDRMHFISVGDSPLYLFRDGELSQLNEDHSLAPQIDFMVKQGLMDPEVGRNHPDRNCLTSVLIGSEIERIDSPESPTDLRHGDRLIICSDGLQFLSDDEIREVMENCRDKNADQTVQALSAALHNLDDPRQDNFSFIVVVVHDDEAVDDIEAVNQDEAVNEDAVEPDWNEEAEEEAEMIELPKAARSSLFSSLRRLFGLGR